jgi:hypothetical protein
VSNSERRLARFALGPTGRDAFAVSDERMLKGIVQQKNGRRSRPMKARALCWEESQRESLAAKV